MQAGSCVGAPGVACLSPAVLLCCLLGAMMPTLKATQRPHQGSLLHLSTCTQAEQVSWTVRRG